MSKMVLDYPEAVEELGKLREHFSDATIVKYAANKNLDTIDNKTIIVDSVFSGRKADSVYHYVEVTIIVNVFGILDDEFFINNEYERPNNIDKNVNGQYHEEYMKNIIVMAPNSNNGGD